MDRSGAGVHARAWLWLALAGSMGCGAGPVAAAAMPRLEVRLRSDYHRREQVRLAGRATDQGWDLRVHANLRWALDSRDPRGFPGGGPRNEVGR